MMRQNQKPLISNDKPLQPGVSGAAARVPDGCSFERALGEGAGKKNPRWATVTKTSTRELKRIHGACKGGNPVVAEELRRRGFNSKMLEELVWDWGQRQWEKNLRQSGHAAAAGAQGKEDELAKWRRLPIKVHSTKDDQRDAPDRRSKQQRRFERRLEKRRQERETGLRPRKK